MIPIYKRPEGVGEWDPPLIRLDDYSISEQIDYWRARASSVKFMHDMVPEAYELFIDYYGEDVAEEILTIAEKELRERD